MCTLTLEQLNTKAVNYGEIWDKNNGQNLWSPSNYSDILLKTKHKWNFVWALLQTCGNTNKSIRESIDSTNDPNNKSLHAHDDTCMHIQCYKGALDWQAPTAQLKQLRRLIKGGLQNKGGIWSSPTKGSSRFPMFHIAWERFPRQVNKGEQQHANLQRVNARLFLSSKLPK